MRGDALIRPPAKPMTYTCDCSCRDEPGSGLVLLYYRYWSKSPLLRPDLQHRSDRPEELAAWYKEVTEYHHLSGKIRVAKEGFNVTVAGSRRDVRAFMDMCPAHWSFDGLTLTMDDQRDMYFKPSPGCACVFQDTSIRVCHEITPFGITNYLPTSWDMVEELSPEAFHARCHEEKTVLLDVRNHYESRIGYFVDPLTGRSAIRPQIRRFSQFPKYVRTHGRSLAESDRIMAYCTGGIRCEKAVRWMAESVAAEGPFSFKDSQICTLQGGIAAYLIWIEAEIREGRLLPGDSLFKGKNFVFDARGSTGLVDLPTAVATCHMCGTSEDRLIKCQSYGCQLLLVVCSRCEQIGSFCCSGCQERDLCESKGTEAAGNPRPMCDCEKRRERGLWGAPDEKLPRAQGWKTARKTKTGLHIPMKTFI